MSVFGTAGARGVFNSTQTPSQVYQLVETAVFVFGKGRYGVGWDGRKSSLILGRVVGSAIAAGGSEAISFGLVPTPVLAYGTRENGCTLGFSVTASHNPPEFSGLKIFNSNGMELSRDEEARIERGMMVNSIKTSTRIGRASRVGALHQYVSAMLSRFTKSDRGSRIVIDCANGPGALATPEILKGLGNDVVTLNSHVSWRFSARAPEPTPETLRETSAFVANAKADFGLAHDGDGDRLVLINSAGRVLPDYVTSILVLEALGTSSGTVVLSENTSFAVEETAERLGMKVMRTKIGKTFAEIEKEGAILATEPSKIVDPRWGMWEDGIYCAALIADVLNKRPDLRAVLDSELDWKFKQLNLPVSVDMGRIATFSDEYLAKFRIAEKRSVDGLRIIFKDKSWVMFRPSGTEPKTRVYCESRDEMRLGELIDAARGLVERSVAKPVVMGR